MTFGHGGFTPDLLTFFYYDRNAMYDNDNYIENDRDFYNVSNAHYNNNQNPTTAGAEDDNNWKVAQSQVNQFIKASSRSGSDSDDSSFPLGISWYATVKYTSTSICGYGGCRLWHIDTLPTPFDSLYIGTHNPPRANATSTAAADTATAATLTTPF